MKMYKLTEYGAEMLGANTTEAFTIDDIASIIEAVGGDPSLLHYASDGSVLDPTASDNHTGTLPEMVGNSAIIAQEI